MWVADVILGDGTPALEAVTTLAAVAGATEQVRIGFSTVVIHVREPIWLGTQVATLQLLSGDRLLLGVGVGGFPHCSFWQALRIPSRERGRRTDNTLSVLPGLVTGQPTRLPDADDGIEVTLAPPAPMPPVLVGGNSAAAIRRAARFGDGWFPSLIGPLALAERTEELAQAASAYGRPCPQITVGGHTTVGDPASVREAREQLVQNLVTVHGLSRDAAEQVAMPGAVQPKQPSTSLPFLMQGPYGSSPAPTPTTSWSGCVSASCSPKHKQCSNSVTKRSSLAYSGRLVMGPHPHTVVKNRGWRFHQWATKVVGFQT